MENLQTGGSSSEVQTVSHITPSFPLCPSNVPAVARGHCPLSNTFSPVSCCPLTKGKEPLPPPTKNSPAVLESRVKRILLSLVTTDTPERDRHSFDNQKANAYKNTTRHVAIR